MQLPKRDEKYLVFSGMLMAILELYLNSFVSDLLFRCQALYLANKTSIILSFSGSTSPNGSTSSVR